MLAYTRWQFRSDDDADEELAHGQPGGGVRAHGHRQRHGVPSAPCSTHAFRNSLIPIATSFGNNITLILTGSFLIEQIFNIDGFGLLGWESLVERDYPVVMGILVISSLLFMIGNILSDICVALVDPRVKFGSRRVLAMIGTGSRAQSADHQAVAAVQVHPSGLLVGDRARRRAFAVRSGRSLLVNSRALVVSYQGDEWHFPTYGDFIPGRTFGLDYDYETNYRELKRTFRRAERRRLGADAAGAI